MNWEILVRVFDILGSVGVVICLNLVAKYYKVWLLYSIVTMLFIVVGIYYSLPGLAVMNIILMFTGLRNYWIGRKGN